MLPFLHSSTPTAPLGQTRCQVLLVANNEVYLHRVDGMAVVKGLISNGRSHRVAVGKISASGVAYNTVNVVVIAVRGGLRLNIATIVIDAHGVRVVIAEACGVERDAMAMVRIGISGRVIDSVTVVG